MNRFNAKGRSRRNTT